MLTENTRSDAGATRHTAPLKETSSYKIDYSGIIEVDRNGRI
jgi:hypothetical protein